MSKAVILSKKDLLLEIARSAVCWGEGSDFEWNELLGEFDDHDSLKFHYKDRFPHAFWHKDMTEEEEDLYVTQSEELQEAVCRDCLDMLKSLMAKPPE